MQDHSLVAGARYVPTYGGLDQCVAGRPFRSETGRVAVSTRGRRVPLRARANACSTAAAEAAGRAWERDAQYECASVPAFLQLARELLAYGAPPELVERALDAACDEIVHAELSAQMASRLLGVGVRPTLPQFRERALPNLTQLAEERWLDGCLGEGAAAERARRGAQLAVDARAKAIQARIAHDETRHSELGWAVLRWTLERGGTEARGAVRALRHVDAPTAEATPPDGREHFGQLSGSEAHVLFQPHALRSVYRLDSSLLFD